MESNHRPHAYQACALTGWAIGPCRVSIGFSFLFPLISIFRVLNVHAFTCTFKDKQYKFCLWRYFYRSTLGILTKLFAQSVLLRKEVIQPQVLLRLPCYDFTPITSFTFGGVLLAVRLPTSGPPGSHGVTGGVYKARERIHRGMLIHDY